MILRADWYEWPMLKGIAGVGPQWCGLISAWRTARTMLLDTPLILYCGSPDGVSGINCTTS